MVYSDISCYTCFRSKFISSTSKKKNGIKNYGNEIYKLKIAKTDIGLVSTKSYIDDAGNTLIIFNIKQLLGAGYAYQKLVN